MLRSLPRTSWLFSPVEDLLAFAAPAALSLLLAAYLSSKGLLSAPLSPVGWLLSVVFVDVAHVWATIYRVYTDPAERRRRLPLYAGLPAAAYAASVLLYALSALTFWRALAYLAVFHFIRQQYGWIRLANHRDRWLSDAATPPAAGRLAALDPHLDGAAIYLGTLYPLVYWHGHLPRSFHWFVAGDFLLTAPPWLVTLAHHAWLIVGVLWSLRQLVRFVSTRTLPVAKILVMTSTWATWYLGIVHWNSDVAFTVTNVLPHGIPYFVLLYRYWSSPAVPYSHPTSTPRIPSARALWLSLPLFLLPLLVIAFVEEALWDRLVWHDHAVLFPLPAIDTPPALLALLVPLLALPQSTHYLLDAWIWRVGPQNPDLRRRLGL